MAAELETRWYELGEFIREQRRVGHLSLRKLSEMAGISNPYLSQIERGLRKPSAEILQQIARALEISSETLYVRAGILEPSDGETDLVAEIRRDPWLNEDQKKTLVQIYESFRAERKAAGFGPPERAEDGPSDDAGHDVDPADEHVRPDRANGNGNGTAGGSDDHGPDAESGALAGRS